MNRTQIYLSESQHDALGALASARATTASALIREAIDRYLVSQLNPRERVDALRAFASRMTKTAAASEGASAAENLQRAGDDRLRFGE